MAIDAFVNFTFVNETSVKLLSFVTEAIVSRNI